MLPFPPNLFSSSMGWQADDPILATEDYHDCTPSKESTEASYQSLVVGEGSSSSAMKLCHNAYERDRRKKLNTLYSSLRNLLPDLDHSRKLSIPLTISRVLKYIPELQRQVERLRRRKKELLVTLSRQEEQNKLVRGVIYPVVSATCLDNTEVMVQVCMLNKDVRISVSKVLKVMETEGLHLMNASSFTTHDDRSFCTLHLQAKKVTQIDGQAFCKRLTEYVKEQAI